MPRLPSRLKNKARIQAYWKGHRGEALAAWFLRFKFYRVLARRFKTPVGEIDLIVERFGVTVFVEVKARSRAVTEAETLEAVNARRITRAAAYWLLKHPARASADYRFDVIFLARGRWPRHVINAFDAS